MRIFDLYFIEALDPLEDVVSSCMNIVDKCVNDYMKIIEKYDYDHWTDDPDILKDLLQENSKGTIFSWELAPKGNGNPVDWYIHSASMNEGDLIHFNLDYTTMEENFGPQTFRKSVKKTVEHESIHIHQSRLLGDELFDAIKSGYRRGMALYEKTSDTQDIFNEYFADPTEMMAHGHDLAIEILEQKAPGKVIQNLKEHIDDLPTLHRHIHRGFPLQHPVTRRMIKYSHEYAAGMIT